jgi:ABC-type lipopolysaccharide export system ATPase subunit
LPYEISGLNILEIPNTGQLLGLPLVGTWIRKLPLIVYRFLFLIYKPRFISFSMHSWDSLDPKTIFKIEEIIKILKKNNYNFLNGEQIFKNRK